MLEKGMVINMKVLISIIVPVYKVERYLKRCIDSILNQTFSDFELILVDDGSPDNSGKICDEYETKDTRIRVIHKTNGGLSEARNYGIDCARGDYLCFIDSDDFVHCQYLEILYSILENSGADMSICGYSLYHDSDTLNTEKYGLDIPYKEFSDELLYDEPFINHKWTNLVCAWNKLYHRDLFKEIRYPVGKIHEDNFTYYKLMDKAKKVVYTDEKLYYYYMSENSISRSGFTDKRLHILQAYQEQIEYFKKRKKQRMVEISFEQYIYWIWTVLKEMKDCGREDSYRMISPYYNKLKKYVFYLKPGRSYPVSKIIKAYYLAYLKRIK